MSEDGMERVRVRVRESTNFVLHKTFVVWFIYKQNILALLSVQVALL